MTRLAILASACVRHDAISNAVVDHAEIACEILGRENVVVFSAFIDRPLPCEGVVVPNSRDLEENPLFKKTDVILVHWGIGHPLFELTEKRFWRSKEALICFHNMTPAHLVEPENQDVMKRSLFQLKRMIKNKRNKFFTFSQFNRETLEGLGLPREEIGDLPFTVEISEVLTKTQTHEPLRVLSVGRMVPAKGFHTILSALKEFHLASSKDFSLTIVSSMTFGNDSYLSELRQLVKVLEIEDKVAFKLDISDEMLRHLYADADLLLLDSAHEGLCVPVIEALRSDVRIVSSNCGNLPHLVNHPDLTVHHLDVQGFSEAIIARVDTFEFTNSQRNEIIEYFSRLNVSKCFKHSLDPDFSSI